MLLFFLAYLAEHHLGLWEKKFYILFYFIFVDVRVNLHAPQLTSRDNLSDPTTF